MFFCDESEQCLYTLLIVSLFQGLQTGSSPLVMIVQLWFPVFYDMMNGDQDLAFYLHSAAVLLYHFEIQLVFLRCHICYLQEKKLKYS